MSEGRNKAEDRRKERANTPETGEETVAFKAAKTDPAPDHAVEEMDRAARQDRSTDSFEIRKVDAGTGAALRGAKFGVWPASVADSERTDQNRIHEYTTKGGQAALVIHKDYDPPNKEYASDTLYYIIETQAADGYQLLSSSRRLYFYYSSEPAAGAARWEPTASDGLPEGATAIDLSVGYGSSVVENVSDAKTSVIANKAWSNVDGSTTAPEGAEVKFTLFANDTQVAGTEITLDGTADAIPEEQAGDGPWIYETQPWKAEWTGLPARDEHHQAITYTVRETTGYTGYTADLASIRTGGIITNVQDSTTVSFDKEWYGSGGTDGLQEAWPGADTSETSDDVTLEFTLTRQIKDSGGGHCTRIRTSATRIQSRQAERRALR